MNSKIITAVLAVIIATVAVSALYAGEDADAAPGDTIVTGKNTVSGITVEYFPEYGELDITLTPIPVGAVTLLTVTPGWTSAAPPAVTPNGPNGVITIPWNHATYGASLDVTVVAGSDVRNIHMDVITKHRVSYYDGNDSLISNTQYVKHGDYATSPPSNPARPTSTPSAGMQWAFDKWVVRGTSTLLTVTEVNGPTEFSALFTEVPVPTTPPTTPPTTATEYTVTLNLDGGTISDSSWTASGANYAKKFATGSSLTLPTPTADGKTFGGWSPTPSSTVTGNVTYKALWTDVVPPANHTVTARVAGDGGTVSTLTRSIEDGGDVTFTFSADPGLVFDRIVTDAKNYEISGNEIRFLNVTSDIDFELVFATEHGDNHWIYILVASVFAAVFAITTLWLLLAGKRRKGQEERS
jgi:hypothetical protein